MTKAEKLLLDIAKRAGVPEDKLKPFEGTDEAAMDAVNIDEVIESVYEAQKKVLENDSDFMDGINKDIHGKLTNTRQQAFLKFLKSHGIEISKAEQEALPEKDRLDKLMELGLKKLSEKKPATNEDADKLQIENAELKEQIRKFNEEEIPAMKTQHETELQKRERLMLLKSDIEKHRENFVTKSPAFERVLIEDFENSYDLGKDDQGNEVLLQKGKQLKVMNGTKNMTREEAWQVIFQRNEAIKKQDTVPPKPPVHTQGAPRGTEKPAFNSAYQEAKKRKEVALAKEKA